MTSNADESVQHVHHDFQNLLAYITGPAARAQTAYTVAWTLCRRRLAVGATLWRRFFVTCAVVRPTEPVLAPDGTRLADHDQRPTTDDSVFGSVRFGRHDCAAPGHDGRCPLAAALSGPARCSADLRREWAADGTTDASSWESQTVLERLPGVSRSLQAIETGVADAEGDVAAFDEQPVEATTPPTGGAILVVQADGTGVPRVQPSTVAPPVRLGKR